MPTPLEPWRAVSLGNDQPPASGKGSAVVRRTEASRRRGCPPRTLRRRRAGAGLHARQGRARRGTGIGVPASRIRSRAVAVVAPVHRRAWTRITVTALIVSGLAAGWGSSSLPRTPSKREPRDRRHSRDRSGLHRLHLGDLPGTGRPGQGGAGRHPRRHKQRHPPGRAPGCRRPGSGHHPDRCAARVRARHQPGHRPGTRATQRNQPAWRAGSSRRAPDHAVSDRRGTRPGRNHQGDRADLPAARLSPPPSDSGPGITQPVISKLPLPNTATASQRTLRKPSAGVSHPNDCDNVKRPLPHRSWPRRRWARRGATGRRRNCRSPSSGVRQSSDIPR